MSVPVVALYGALNAIFNVVLAMRVSGGRMKEKVSIGPAPASGGAGARALDVMIRTHGNNAEFVPLALLLLLIAELMGGSSTALHVLGGTLFVARISHAIGMPRRAPNVFRATGATV
ncbi:MAG: MAPEG family protein, partial [Myxococcales bacterium]|nr:MAPEG family protein [Myxococcales bacterium]